MGKYELLNFCELDKYAIKSYCAIHNIDSCLNLGDITKVDIESLPLCDLITHGSPCQSFSVAGLQGGGDENSGTQSSLLWNSVKIIKHCKPKFVIWENVKNVLSAKNIHNFKKYLKTMDNMGYNSYYEILYGPDYNIPQTRERIIVVSISKSIDNGKFTFVKPQKEDITFHDFLDKKVDLKYNKKDFFDSKEKYKNETWDENTIYKLVDNKNKISKRNDGKIYTLTKSGRNCGNNIYIASLGRVLTPCECIKLMGFDLEDYQAIKSVNVPDTHIYEQAGNSIIVNKIYLIYKELLNLFPDDFMNDMKMISLFSGIGAFEKALSNLEKDMA